jgi:TolB-like protein/Tfp pilus assembly protein PilF
VVKYVLSEIARRRVIPILAPYAIVTWLVMQIVTLVIPALAFPQWIVSLVVVLLLAGFPVALYVAWFFDITSEGFKRTPGRSDDVVEAPLTKGHWFGFAGITIAAFGVGVLSFGSVRENLEAPREPLLAAVAPKSIAVLPFRDLSPEQDRGFLADGLAEELVVALGRIDGLQVMAASSSFALRDRVLVPRDRAALLGVSTLLEGTVRQTGDRVNVTATLVNGANGQTLWTEKFTRSFEDIFEVEEEIGRAILATVLDRYIEKDGAPIVGRATSADAYVMYLRGKQAFRLRTTESLKQARKFFEQAISSDPEYAPAYVGLANSIYLLSEGEKFFGNLDPEIAATLAMQNVEKALVRDPGLAEAYASLGLIQSRTDHEAALASYDKALEINESYADVWVWRYLSLLALSRVTEAFENLQKAGDLDPLSHNTLHNLGWEMSKRGEMESAYAYFNQMIELDPRSPLPYKGLADATFRAGNIANSAQYFKKASDLSGDSRQFQTEVLGFFITLNLIDPVREQLPEDYRANVLIADEKFKELFELMSFETAAHPDDPYIMLEAGLYEQLYGDAEKALVFLAKAMELSPVQEQFYMPYCSPAIEFAFALQQAGRTEEAAVLIEKCQQLYDSEISGRYVSSVLDYLGARLAAMLGDDVSALERLQTAYDHGWREYWTGNDPILKSLAGQEVYEDLLSRIDNDLSEQRQALADISSEWFEGP